MPLASIIVPVYNSAQFLSECFQSICDQSCDDYELIFVDDGSTDNSPEMIREFQISDSRVKLLHQDKKGAGAARNLALDIAQGEYIFFLDSDDIAKPNLLKTVIDILSVEKSDICFFDATTSTNPSLRSFLNEDLLPIKSPFDPTDLAEVLFQILPPAPWLRAMRREFVSREKLRFQEIERANDLFFTTSASCLAKTISFTTSPLVQYRDDNHGSLQATLERTPLDSLAALSALKEFLFERNLINSHLKSFEEMAYKIFRWTLWKINNFEYFSEYLSQYSKLIADLNFVAQADDMDFRESWNIRIAKTLFEVKTEEASLRNQLHSAWGGLEDLRGEVKRLMDENSQIQKEIDQLRRSKLLRASERVKRLLNRQ